MLSLGFAGMGLLAARLLHATHRGAQCELKRRRQRQRQQQQHTKVTQVHTALQPGLCLCLCPPRCPLLRPAYQSSGEHPGVWLLDARTRARNRMWPVFGLICKHPPHLHVRIWICRRSEAPLGPPLSSLSVYLRRTMMGGGDGWGWGPGWAGRAGLL